MNKITFGPYSKFIVAVIGATAAWATASFADTVVSPQEWVALVVAILTALGVYSVANTPEARR
jgi:hypothetical protein